MSSAYTITVNLNKTKSQVSHTTTDHNFKILQINPHTITIEIPELDCDTTPCSQSFPPMMAIS